MSLQTLYNISELFPYTLNVEGLTAASVASGRLSASTPPNYRGFPASSFVHQLLQGFQGILLLFRAALPNRGVASLFQQKGDDASGC
jgi:hypothetical protein